MVVMKMETCYQGVNLTYFLHTGYFIGYFNMIKNKQTIYFTVQLDSPVKGPFLVCTNQLN